MSSLEELQNTQGFIIRYIVSPNNYWWMCCNHLQSLLPAVPLLELNRSYIFCEIFVRKNISILNPNKCKSKPLTGVKARKKVWAWKFVQKIMCTMYWLTYYMNLKMLYA